MKPNILRFAILYIISITYWGCDPTYSISIQNASNNVIEIEINENERFHSKKVPKEKLAQGVNLYELKPNEKMKTGLAIAELVNDIPYNSLRITKRSQLIEAQTAEEILDLFDKNNMEKLKKPYIITIK